MKVAGIRVASLTGAQLPAMADVKAAYAQVGEGIGELASYGVSLIKKALEFIENPGDPPPKGPVRINATVNPYSLKISCSSRDHPGKQVVVTMEVLYVRSFLHDTYLLGGEIGETQVQLTCDFTNKTAILALLPA